MSSFWIEGNQYDSAEVDVPHQLRRHARGYFWAEHRDRTLEVHGVAEGGWWCQLRDPHGGLSGDAVGPDAHGLVHTWDGGGVPFLVRRVCALPEALALAVLARFVRDGGRSDAVRWDHGVVRDGWGWVWRAAGTVDEYEEARHLEHRRDGGLRLELFDPISPTRAHGPVWSAITELELGFAGGLELLADHPIADLRALIVSGEDLPLASLQAALDAHPGLTALTISVARAAALPRLRAPGLRDLHLVGDAGAGEPLAARARRDWDLPALARVAVVADDDYDEDDEDEDDDEDAD